jgi:drug/metabolite transporter (DMT)-like permease
MRDSGAARQGARWSGLGWGLCAVAIWSGSFVLTRLGVRTTLNAYDITALRFGFGALVLLPVVWKKGFAVARVGWPGLVLLVSGTGAPYALLIAAGLQFAPASEAAALVPGPMSVMAALLGTVLLGERLAARGWWGAGAILLGSLLIAGGAATPGERCGDAAFLLAALLWAGYVIVLRRTRLPALHATAIVSVGSAAAYLPVYAAFLPVGLGHAPLSDIAAQAVYQGGLTTVVGLIAFNRAVALLGAAAGAALPALVPVATLVMAALLLNETPSPAAIAAAILVAAGVLLVTSARRLPRPTAPPPRRSTSKSLQKPRQPAPARRRPGATSTSRRKRSAGSLRLTPRGRSAPRAARSSRRRRRRSPFR